MADYVGYGRMLDKTAGLRREWAPSIPSSSASSPLIAMSNPLLSLCKSALALTRRALAEQLSLSSSSLPSASPVCGSTEWQLLAHLLASPHVTVVGAGLKESLVILEHASRGGAVCRGPVEEPGIAAALLLGSLPPAEGDEDPPTTTATATAPP